VALLAIPVLALAACGSDSKKNDSTQAATPPPATSTKAPTASGGGQNLTLTADPAKIGWDKTTLSAKSGKVTITLDNPSQIPHAVAVEGNGIDKDGKVVQKGGKSVVTANLKPGKYEFYCPVDGHKAQGMKGTLTVN
jgi:plastocyanin